MKSPRSHKYSVGQEVYDKRMDEFVTVEQKRIENGHICYRISTGAVRHENLLIRFYEKAL